MAGSRFAHVSFDANSTTGESRCRFSGYPLSSSLPRAQHVCLYPSLTSVLAAVISFSHSNSHSSHLVLATLILTLASLLSRLLRLYREHLQIAIAGKKPAENRGVLINSSRLVPVSACAPVPPTFPPSSHISLPTYSLPRSVSLATRSSAGVVVTNHRLYGNKFSVRIEFNTTISNA
jgi:hypothetical protein